jgi:histone H3/H4
VSSSKTTHLALLKTPFANLCKYIVDANLVKGGLRYGGDTLLTLQEAAEGYMGRMLKQSVFLAKHARRVACSAADLEAAYKMEHGTELRAHAHKPPKMPLKNLFEANGIQQRSDVELDAKAYDVLHAFCLRTLDGACSLVKSRQPIGAKKTSTMYPEDVAFSLRAGETKVYGIANSSRG